MMDMRDPWEGYGTEGKSYTLSRWINRGMARRAFRRASRISLAWPGIRDITEAAIPGASLAHSHSIPNGFDYAPRWEKAVSIPKAGARFTITYAGSFYARRYPETFIQNLGEALRVHPELADRLCLQIIGRIDPSVTERLESCLPPKMLEISTYLPHQELMQVLEKTDALWIVMDDVKESMHIVAGKTYEYLGLGKPILACVPPGSQSAKVIESTHTGVVVEQDNPIAIAQLLQEWLKQWQNGNPIVQANQELVNQYHRRNTAGSFAAHFEQVVKENEKI
jgi:glycosyltransferase involved in cell wall biosynthesis